MALHFARTSEKLHIEQPSLSREIKELAALEHRQNGLHQLASRLLFAEVSSSLASTVQESFRRSKSTCMCK
jgi:DNA-binding transcriptional LysR family regulator